MNMSAGTDHSNIVSDMKMFNHKLSFLTKIILCWRFNHENHSGYNMYHLLWHKKNSVFCMILTVNINYFPNSINPAVFLAET